MGAIGPAILRRMKTPIALALALALAALASASDITLSDGRTLRDATVVSASAGRVCIRHPGGFVQVDKKLLTGDLAERYPADASATAREDSRLAADAQEKAERDARAAEQIRTVQRSRSSYSASSDEPAEDLTAEQIKSAARDYAQSYFERDQPGSTNSWSFTANCDVSEPEPMAGWVDQWRVSGSVGTRDLSSQGGLSSPTHRFEAIVAKRGSRFVVIDFTKR